MNEKTILPPQKEGEGLLITPLLDLMFLVLIFFALNLSYQNLDSLNVEIPKTGNLNALTDDETHLLIEVSYRGELMVEEQVFSLPELRDYLFIQLAENESLPVYVAGDQQTEYRILMKVLDVLSEAGASKIHLITEDD